MYQIQHLMKNRKILIAGSAGQLATEFISTLTERNYHFVVPSEEECNITDFEQMKGVIERLRPNIIINCAAYNAVDQAEEKSDLAYLVNSESVENLAKLCNTHNILLVHYSSDYVFDGEKQDLYQEEDRTNPLNAYGQSKLDGEKAITRILSDYLIFRLSWVIGPGKQNFLFNLSNWAENNRILKISSDEVSVPTFAEVVVNATLLSLDTGLRGLYHLTNSGYASRYELARYYVEKKGLKNLVVPVACATFKTIAERPLFSAMSNQKITHALKLKIPTWQESLEKYLCKN